MNPSVYKNREFLCHRRLRFTRELKDAKMVGERDFCGPYNNVGNVYEISSEKRVSVSE